MFARATPFGMEINEDRVVGADNGFKGLPVMDTVVILLNSNKLLSGVTTIWRLTLECWISFRALVASH